MDKKPSRLPAPAAACFALVVGPLFGCSAPKPEPAIASSAAHGTYALNYPTVLNATATGFSERQSSLRKVFATFKDYPSKLKDPSFPRVLEVYQRADETGRSYAYVERMRRVEGAHVFFDTERDELVRKVGGSAQFVVKKKSCEVDVTDAVAGSMKTTVDRQLEKELRDASEAHFLIERYKNQLKKDNVAELEKQADAIEFASYVVHIELVEEKLRLRRMLEEVEEAKGSQDKFIAAERAFQGEKGTTDAEKKESEARIEAMKKSQAKLDAALSQARELAPKVEEQIAGIQREYKEAFDGLRAKVEAKGGK